MDDVSDANDVMNDNVGQGVDELPELTPDYEEVDRNSDDEEDSVHDEEFDEDSVGDIPNTGQRTRSGRVSMPSNSLIPSSRLLS